VASEYGSVSPVDARGGDAGLASAVGELFSYVDIEARMPSRHPLRTIVNECLASLDAEFDAV
jgi:hypothetical protein